MNKLEVGDRGATIVEKNNFKLSQLEDVKEWFGGFGVEVEDSYRFGCWQEVNGRPRQEQVLVALRELMGRLLEYKKIYKGYVDGLKQKQ